MLLRREVKRGSGRKTSQTGSVLKDANRRSRSRTASLKEANASSVSPRAACAAAKYTGDTFSPSDTRSSRASNRHSQYPSAPSERSCSASRSTDSASPPAWSTHILIMSRSCAYSPVDA